MYSEQASVMIDVSVSTLRPPEKHSAGSDKTKITWHFKTEPAISNGTTLAFPTIKYCGLGSD
jgi:hypothetical protein